MRISDWSPDVCSSDLQVELQVRRDREDPCLRLAEKHLCRLVRRGQRIAVGVQRIHAQQCGLPKFLMATDQTAALLALGHDRIGIEHVLGERSLVPEDCIHMTVVVGRDQSACAPCRSRDQAELALAATAIGRGTCPISRRYTVKVALGDDVGYARDGIRTVYGRCAIGDHFRSEENTSELQSLMRISY